MGAIQKTGLLATVVVTAAPILAGLGHGPRTANAAAANVTLNNFAFTPATTNITAGDSVTWSNVQAGVTHTATSDTGVWDSGNIAASGTFSQTFPSAGTFPYHCSIHPSMTGTIVAAAAVSPTVATATASATTTTATTSPTATLAATATPTSAPPTASATATTPSATPTRTATQAATAAASSPTPAAPATGGGSGSGGGERRLYLALAVAGAGIVTAGVGSAIALRRRS